MKTKFFIVISFLFGLNISMRSQLFIRDNSIITSGVTQDYPVDVNYHSVPNRYFTLHHSSNGNMPVLQYHGSAYSPITGANLFKTGVIYDPISMVHNGNFTAVLFNIPAAQSSYGICVYNHNTNTILWAKFIKYGNPLYDFFASDIALDATGTNLYVLGRAQNSNTGKSDLYVAKLNAMTGILNWHRRITNSTYDFEPNNIHFHSNTEIYIAAGASASILNRGAFVAQIDNNGVILNHSFIQYNSSCTPHRLTAPSIKRLNNDVYFFCPSVVGADGSGAYFLARMTSNLSSVTAFNVYDAVAFYFYGFKAPEFEFVNNNTAIMVSGIRSFLNSSSDGYMHAIYDLNTNFISAITYQNQNVGMYGTPIFDSYNPASNKVFSVAQDAANPSQFYTFKSFPSGDISTKCDTPYFQNPIACKIVASTLSVTSYTLKGQSKNIKAFKISGVDHKFVETCSFQCATCRELPETNNAADKEETLQRSSLQGTIITEETFNLYPNPASTSLNIKYPGEIRTIEIFDLHGRVKTVTPNNDDLETQVDVSEFADGIYFVQIIDAFGQMKIKKFVKN